jgi:hypothetical protein
MGTYIYFFYYACLMFGGYRCILIYFPFPCMQTKFIHTMDESWKRDASTVNGKNRSSSIGKSY